MLFKDLLPCVDDRTAIVIDLYRCSRKTGEVIHQEIIRTDGKTARSTHSLYNYEVTRADPGQYVLNVCLTKYVKVPRKGFHPVRDAVNAGILDLGGQGRDKYGR